MDKEKLTAEFTSELSAELSAELTADKFSEICRLIAPSGALRVGLYPGSPNSFIPSTSDADHRGVGFELGQALAKILGIAFEPVIFNMNAEVLTGAWGLEKISIGIPFARRRALPYVQSFADDMQTSLFIEQAALRAGLRSSTLGQQS